MRHRPIILFVALITLIATLSVAADPEPQKPVDPPTSPERSAVPDLAINQDEIATGVVSDPVENVTKQLSDTAVKPMIAEIESTMAARQAEIAELSASASSSLDHDADLAIQMQIAELKMQTELDILAIQARYARADGQEELAQRIEADIAAIISPPAPIAPATTRPAPGNQH